MAPMDQDTRGDDGATEGCESVAVEKQSTAQVGMMRFCDSAKSCVSNDVICPLQEEGSNQQASGRVGSFQTDRKVPAGCADPTGEASRLGRVDLCCPLLTIDVVLYPGVSFGSPRCWNKIEPRNILCDHYVSRGEVWRGVCITGQLPKNMKTEYASRAVFWRLSCCNGEIDVADTRKLALKMRSW